MTGKYYEEHAWLLHWHSRHFYPFLTALSAEELAYLYTCFRLYDAYVEVSPGGYEHFSLYTYSHRVQGDQVNSSRLAYGSFSKSSEAWDAAIPVLAQHRAPFDRSFLEIPGMSFLGLGWDLLAQHLKVYLHSVDLHKLTATPLRELMTDHREYAGCEGLVSMTYVDGALHERKLYVPPLVDPAADGIHSRMIMNTNLRGPVEQHNVSDWRLWLERINDVGQRIVYRYAEIGETLDTIAYTDRNNYTLYFP